MCVHILRPWDSSKSSLYSGKIRAHHDRWMELELWARLLYHTPPHPRLRCLKLRPTGLPRKGGQRVAVFQQPSPWSHQESRIINFNIPTTRCPEDHKKGKKWCWCGISRLYREIFKRCGVSSEVRQQAYDLKSVFLIFTFKFDTNTDIPLWLHIYP